MAGRARFRIASYNVLSSSLCAPPDFPACTPENLHPSNRLPRVQAKLETEIRQSAIICLQEVSRTWCGPLQIFFLSHDYEFAHSLYGSAFNDYMGVAVAWPRRMQLQQLEAVRVADVKLKPPRAPPPPPPPSLWRRAMDYVWALVFPGSQVGKIDNVWDLALNRFNTMVAARLRCPDTKAEVVVGTYHMPCMFDKPQVMTIHAALCAQTLQRISGTTPHILAGDFNFKPGDPQYRLITTGTLADPHRPPAMPGDSWSVDLEHAMHSAYKERLGAEPRFTNYNKFRGGAPFIDTLDYIFCAPGVVVEDVLPLPADPEQVAGPFPTETEPSDHLMVAATVSVPMPA